MQNVINYAATWTLCLLFRHWPLNWLHPLSINSQINSNINNVVSKKNRIHLQFIRVEFSQVDIIQPTLWDRMSEEMKFTWNILPNGVVLWILNSYTISLFRKTVTFNSNYHKNNWFWHQENKRYTRQWPSIEGALL